MMRTLLLVALLGLPWTAHSADCASSRDSDLADVLSFKVPVSGALPGGWRIEPAGTASVDAQGSHGTDPSIRIEPKANAASGFSDLSGCLQMDFVGSKIELRGFLRTQDVQGFAGLWLREDANGRALDMDNMQAKGLKGTTGWTEYSVAVPRHPAGQKLAFGAYLSGSGKVWVSGLQLLVDGRPVWQAPAAPPERTPLATDHEFDKGSGIVIGALNPSQVANLVTLGKVWGFLKYYHPAVRTGQRQWDFDLFRILPAVLAAPDRASADAVMVHWIGTLGPVTPCDSCAAPDKSQPQLQPDLAWIRDAASLGNDLSQSLQAIQAKGRRDQQFYAETAQEGNPAFDNELPYKTVRFPDAGFQLLALYRFWNIVEYWSPYRDAMGEDWDQVLTDFIPRLTLAESRDSYVRQMMMLIAKIHDSHANLWSELAARPPVGDCRLPVQVRYIQDQPTVSGVSEGMASGLKVGDVLTKLDSVPIEQSVKSWIPFYGASNQPTLLRNIADDMTRGSCGETDVELRRGDEVLHLRAKRLPVDDHNHITYSHDLAGPTFRLLSPEVAYLKLSSVKAQAVADYVKQAAGTKGMIIDIRNYPADFVVFALGSLLVDRATLFARFTLADPAEPGTFRWTPPESLTPAQPHYGGKVVILVDETTQSSAEYTSMALRSAPGAVVVGSTTAGADGDVSEIPLPGGLSTMISGLGVFYPDDKPTQRVGILPDVVVRPTLAGIRAGRDEVLERGLQVILGDSVPETDLHKLYAELPPATHP